MNKINSTSIHTRSKWTKSRTIATSSTEIEFLLFNSRENSSLYWRHFYCFQKLLPKKKNESKKPNIPKPFCNGFLYRFDECDINSWIWIKQRHIVFIINVSFNPKEFTHRVFKYYVLVNKWQRKKSQRIYQK